MQGEYKSISFKDIPFVPETQIAYEKGESNYSAYMPEQLFEMLESGDIDEFYEALGAMARLKLKEALPYLKNSALYADDIAMQEEAIRTIRKIGGKNAFDILRFLKTTEHKRFIEELKSKSA